ncbi:MAG: excinuclease ABC subunit C [Patiriisocius sp.]
MQVSDHIRSLIKKIPNRPGIYRFYDTNDEIIYVGKAKKLKNRVSSYFNKNKYDSSKTKALVRRIRDIQIMEVNSEQDALLLENTLIKKHTPKYNIQLKDNKSFPWICIKKEPFPRIFSTRNTTNKRDEFYGPYASVKMMHGLLDLIRKMYKIRTCKLSLTDKNIAKQKFKLCLEYHIGNCKGPCVGNQKQEDYERVINEIRYILKGNLSVVFVSLNKEMKEYANKLEFEEAQLIKEKIARLQKYQGKSTVVSVLDINAEVYGLVQGFKRSFVHYMKVVEGSIVNGYTIELNSHLEESEEEILGFAIQQIREKIKEPEKLVLVSNLTDIIIDGTEIMMPQRGDKKLLVELAERNAKYFMFDKNKQDKVVDPDRHYKRVLEQTKVDLRLTELPVHIECFDNSNFQGTNAVAACVVFRNAKPAKKDYRHFNIKTVVGPDDYASMEEVLYRRYKRLLDEKESLPQLIVIDGGKGQLSAAVKSLEKLNLRGKISIIGIAKRLEEIYFPDDPIPLYIDKRSESLKLIQNLRNEAHRFGITHHRNKRSKAAIGTELTQINGVGQGTADLLLHTFGSVKNVKEATEEQLRKHVGPSKASIVFEYFRNKL